MICSYAKALSGHISKRLEDFLNLSCLGNICADLKSEESEENNPKGRHSGSADDESNADKAAAGANLDEEPISQSQHRKSVHIVMQV